MSVLYFLIVYLSHGYRKGKNMRNNMFQGMMSKNLHGTGQRSVCLSISLPVSSRAGDGRGGADGVEAWGINIQKSTIQKIVLKLTIYTIFLKLRRLFNSSTAFFQHMILYTYFESVSRLFTCIVFVYHIQLEANCLVWKQGSELRGSKTTPKWPIPIDFGVCFEVFKDNAIT